MLTFTDGPAEGETLDATRAPRFLRVAQNGPCFRALAALADEPHPTEILYAYVRLGSAQWVTRGETRIPLARYQLCSPQPAECQMDSTHAWRGWTQRMDATPEPTR